MKKTIPYLIFVLLIPVVYGSICVDPIPINTNCTLINPSADNCTIFTVLNLTGSIITNGTTENLYGNITYFNWTLGEGNYIVTFCNSTLKEIRVTQEDTNKMIIAVLILIPILFGFMLLYSAKLLGEIPPFFDDDLENHTDHGILKMFLVLASPITFWVSLHFGIISIVKFYDFNEIQNLIGDTTYWTAWFFFILLSYFSIYIIYRIYKRLGDLKLKKKGY